MATSSTSTFSAPHCAQRAAPPAPKQPRLAETGCQHSLARAQALGEMEDAAATGMAPIMYDADERMIYEAA